jgi:hypothetical protein
MKRFYEGVSDLGGASAEAGYYPNPLTWFRKPRVILTGLIGVELLLVAAFLLAYWAGHPYEAVTRLINLDTEANLPTWFSSVQLFAAGLTAAAIGFSGRSKSGTRLDADTWIWLTAAATFLFLSLDEAAQFHEALGGILSQRMSASGLQHGFWIVVFLPAGLVALGVEIWLLPRLFPESIQARTCFVLGCLLIIVAAGLEIVSYGLKRSLYSASYVVEVSVEEFSEMLGGTLVLHAFLLRLDEGWSGEVDGNRTG